MCDVTILTCGVTHFYVHSVPIVCVTRLIHMCDMAHSCECHESFMFVT